MPDKTQWHRWFAWHPIIVEDADYRRLVFWEDVMRRRVLNLDLCDGSYCWQYELIDQAFLYD